MGIIMDKLKEKLSRLMYGRYGIDQLGNFMMWAAVAMMIFGAVVRSGLMCASCPRTIPNGMRKTRNSWN